MALPAQAELAIAVEPRVTAQAVLEADFWSHFVGATAEIAVDIVPLVTAQAVLEATFLNGDLTTAAERQALEPRMEITWL